MYTVYIYTYAPYTYSKKDQLRHTHLEAQNSHLFGHWDPYWSGRMKHTGHRIVVNEYLQAECRMLQQMGMGQN